MRRYSQVRLLVLPLLLLGACGDPAAVPFESPTVEVVPYLWGTDIFLVEGDRRLDLTHFRPPRGIMDHAVSPDGRFVFARHSDVGPHQISVFELRHGQRVGHWKPGFGGTMGWTPASELIHTWGCGTQCANAVLWSPEGEQLETHFGDGFLLSPDNRLLASFNGYCPEGPRIELRDLAAHRSIEEQPTGGVFGWLEEWSFTDGGELQVTVGVENDEPRHLRLSIP